MTQGPMELNETYIQGSSAAPRLCLELQKNCSQEALGEGRGSTTMTTTVLLLITGVRRALASLCSSLLSDDMSYILGTEVSVC